MIIKQSPEDFCVEEIGLDGKVFEIDKKVKKKGGPTENSEFTHFVMQKRNLDTFHAILLIANQLNIGRKRFGYAGMKDKISVSTQLVSVWGIEPEELKTINIEGIKILGMWKADKKIEMGDLLGNRFTIKTDLKKIKMKKNGMFPNYFGEQRFGEKGDTYLIGERILKQDYKGAVEKYLDKKRIGLYERILIKSLNKNPNDYIGALRRLPRGLSLMFVHAFQSYIFNEMLKERINDFKITKKDYFCKADKNGFPEIEKIEKVTNLKDAKKKFEKMKIFIVGNLVGYESKPNQFEEDILNKFGLTNDSFKIKSIPELSSRGALRPLFAPYKNLIFKNGIIKFELPSGSYATTFLRTFES